MKYILLFLYNFIYLLVLNLNGFYANIFRSNFIQGGATNLPYPRTEK